MVQIEHRIYPLGVEEMELVVNYLNGLMKRGEAIQLGDSTYYLCVHGGGFNVSLESDEGGGILEMIGDSFTLGRTVTHLRKRLGRLEAEKVLKVGEEQPPINL